MSSLAEGRLPRANAGSRMSKLLNEEEEDAFYTTTYGGFGEEEDDNDYHSESSEVDEVDSDFDIDEQDKGKEDDDDDEDDGRRRNRGGRQRGRVVTKAYKEPAPKKAKVSAPRRPSRVARKPEGDDEEEEGEMGVDPPPLSIDKKSLRRSTAAKSEALAARESRRESRKEQMRSIAQRKNVPEVRRLTQEELLAEAKITEEINLRSLAQYQRLEIERKRAKAAKVVVRRPQICFYSIAVPAIEADEAETAKTVEVDLAEGMVEKKPLLLPPHDRSSRNFVTFTDESDFKAVFPRAAGSRSGRPRLRDQVCPLTGERARYMDPLTRTPFASLAAFKALRALYAMSIRTGERSIDLLRKFRQGEIQL